MPLGLTLYDVAIAALNTECYYEFTIEKLHTYISRKVFELDFTKADLKVHVHLLLQLNT